MPKILTNRDLLTLLRQIDGWQAKIDEAVFWGKGTLPHLEAARIMLRAARMHVSYQQTEGLPASVSKPGVPEPL